MFRAPYRAERHRRIVVTYRLRKSAALLTPCFGRFRFVKNNTQLFLPRYYQLRYIPEKQK